MGSGGMCVGPCPPTQSMAYSQNMASSRINRPVEQSQQAVGSVAISNANSKNAAVSIATNSNSRLDLKV